MSKRIKGITIELDGETKGLDKALQDVNKRSRDVSKELRDVERLLKFSPGNTELVAQKQKLLGDQVQATKEKLDRLKGSQEQVNEAFKRGDISEEQYRAFQREIAETESKLQHYEGQLKSTQDRMKQFGEAVGETGEKFKAAGDKMTSAGKSLSTKVTAPIAGLAAVAVKTGVDFESAMSKVRAISGATGEDMEKLETQARDLGKTTVFSASQAAEAQSFLAMAGYDVSQIMSSLPGLLDLAAAGELDLGRAADITTNIMSGFNLEAEKTGAVADVLALSAASANTSVEQMGSAMSYVAPVAAGAGISLEETAAAIGLLSDSGIQGERAGTALRGAITRLQNPVGEAKKVMEELGLTMDDVNPSTNSLSEILQRLEESGMDSAQAVRMFGEAAGPGMVSLLTAGSASLTDFTNNLEESEGAASNMGKTMTDNLKGDITQFMSAISELGIQIYNVLQPAFREFTQRVISLVERLQGLSPQLRLLIVLAAGIAAAIGPLLLGLGLFTSAIGSVMTTLSAIIPLLPKLGAAFTALTGPVGIVIGIITALIAIGVLLWKNWDTIKAKTTEIWGTISKFLDDTWKSIKKAIETVWNSITDFFAKTWGKITTLFNSVLDNISKVIQRYWDSIKDGVEQVWNGIASYFEGIWELIKNIFVGAFLVLLQLITGQWDEAKKSTEQIWENIKNALSNMWEGIKGVFSGALSAVLGFVKTYFTDAKYIIIAIWEGIKSFISTTVENIKNTISNGFNSMKQSVSDTMSEAWQTIQNIWIDILDFLKGIDLFQIGKDIISGLINGIKSMASAAVNAVKGVVDGAISGAKNLLGIKSPSRVFMDIGKDTGEGLEIGMRSMGSRIKKAGQAIADAAIPNTQNVNVSGGYNSHGTMPTQQGNVIHQSITINSPQPTSPSENARRIKDASRQLAMEWR